MQAGKTKAERKASRWFRTSVRADKNLNIRVNRQAQREAKRVEAQSWESVAKVYASPEGIAKTKAIHKQQCESLRTAKANSEVRSRRWKLELAVA